MRSRRGEQIMDWAFLHEWLTTCAVTGTACVSRQRPVWMFSLVQANKPGDVTSRHKNVVQGHIKSYGKHVNTSHNFVIIRRLIENKKKPAHPSSSVYTNQNKAQHTSPDFAEISSAQLFRELYLVTRYFPFVSGFSGQIPHLRLRPRTGVGEQTT